METIAAFEQLINSLNFFVDAYESLAELTSVVHRLSEFTDNTEKALSIDAGHAAFGYRRLRQRKNFLVRKSREIIFIATPVFVNSQTGSTKQTIGAEYFHLANNSGLHLIKKHLPNAGIVSVGHRSTIFALHDKELNLSGGSWKLRTI